MSFVELQSPKVRSSELVETNFAYKFEKSFPLPKPFRVPRSDFFKILAHRRSRKEFSALTLGEISTVLWFTCKTFKTVNESSKRILEYRCTPSAGGKHPIDVLIATPSKNNEQLFFYDSISHSLKLIKVRKQSFQALRLESENVVPVGGGSIIWFVGQFQKTLSKYQDGESLVWRDSGALLATFYLVSEALSLNCCAIGITGEPFVSNLFGKPKMVRGVGGCVIGARRSLERL